MNVREVAWRVFSEEYNSSTLEYTGEGEKPVSYVITPLGAKINRMLVIGVATDIESLGDKDKPRYRARIADPTGTFYVSAGEYQPSAAGWPGSRLNARGVPSRMRFFTVGTSPSWSV